MVKIINRYQKPRKRANPPSTFIAPSVRHVCTKKLNKPKRAMRTPFAKITLRKVRLGQLTELEQVVVAEYEKGTSFEP